jgi:hypothetical protein
LGTAHARSTGTDNPVSPTIPTPERAISISYRALTAKFIETLLVTRFLGELPFVKGGTTGAILMN